MPAVPKPGKRQKTKRQRERSEKKHLKIVADRLVSAIVILRDARCMTCGVINGSLQPGHFFGRGCEALRWDMRNVMCQCSGCNIYHETNSEPLRKVIIREIGQAEFDELEQLAHTALPDPNMSEIVHRLKLHLTLTARWFNLSDDLQNDILTAHKRFTNKRLIAAIHGITTT